MFDLSPTKLLVLAVIAIVIFGPNELPRIARQAGRMLRDLRRIAEGAKADLREGLGPEFQDFDFDDLNPRRFVQKHLLEEPAADAATDSPVGAMAAVKDAAATNGSAPAEASAPAVAGSAAVSNAAQAATAEADDRPPFDLEAT